jgi:hypothetical protein
MKLIYDRKIESPGTLNEIDFDRILVALKNPVMEKEIEEQLCQSGFNEKTVWAEPEIVWREMEIVL